MKKDYVVVYWTRGYYDGEFYIEDVEGLMTYAEAIEAESNVVGMNATAMPCTERKTYHD